MYYTNVVLDMFTILLYVTYMTSQSWLYSSRLVTGCHYTDRFIITVLYVLLVIGGIKLCQPSSLV